MQFSLSQGWGILGPGGGELGIVGGAGEKTALLHSNWLEPGGMHTVQPISHLGMLHCSCGTSFSTVRVSPKYYIPVITFVRLHNYNYFT